MSNIYRNSEGYYDPTAGKALSCCHHDSNGGVRKQSVRKHKEWRPIVYICSPYAGDTVRNILAAQKYCKFAVTSGYIPFASHLLYPQFLNDDDPEERKLGLFFGNVFMDKCDEIWLFGSSYSAGMQTEYDRAVRKGYKIRFFSTDCVELEKFGNGGADGCL